MTAWILQANPKTWRVWDWYNYGASAEPLTRWTVAYPKRPVKVGDDFALWVAGPGGGVCALGTITKEPYGPEISPSSYWIEQPKEPSWGVGIHITRSLFNPVLLRETLAADPGFADSLILKMPRAGNPIALTSVQWATILEHAQALPGTVAAPEQTQKLGSGQPILTTMPLLAAQAESEILPKEGPMKRKYEENKLVLAYQKYLDRPLVRRSVVLPSKERTRLICDAYDAQTQTLIEAKNSAGRENVRMAIGQLLDYDRHFSDVAHRAVLLPERPTEDLVQLIAAVGFQLVYRQGSAFETVPAVSK